jgi:hypothetical protein
MTPMVSRPLPESLVKKRQEKKQPPKKKRKKNEILTLGVMASAAMVGGVAAMLIWAGLRTKAIDRKPYEQPVDKQERIDELLEVNDGWYKDPERVKLARAKKMLDEAYKGSKIAARHRQKTSLMTINLRVLVNDPTKKVKMGKVGKKKDVTEEIEGASARYRPSRPAPRKTDDRGRVLPGEDDTEGGKKTEPIVE